MFWDSRPWYVVGVIRAFRVFHMLGRSGNGGFDVCQINWKFRQSQDAHTAALACLQQFYQRGDRSHGNDHQRAEFDGHALFQKGHLVA